MYSKTFNYHHWFGWPHTHGSHFFRPNFPDFLKFLKLLFYYLKYGVIFVGVSLLLADRLFQYFKNFFGTSFSNLFSILGKIPRLFHS